MTKMLPNLNKQGIKEFVVENKSNGKTFSKIARALLEPIKQKLLAETIKKLDNITVDDIDIEEVVQYPDVEKNVYTICIHDFLRYALIESSTGDITFEQLDFKKKIIYKKR